MELYLLIDQAAAAMLLLFVLFALAVTPFTYIMSFVFKDKNTAQIATLAFGWISGFALALTSFLLGIATQRLQDINKDLLPWFRLLPFFAFGENPPL